MLPENVRWILVKRFDEPMNAYTVQQSTAERPQCQRLQASLSVRLNGSFALPYA